MTTFNTQVLQQLATIRANQTQAIIPKLENIMSTLSDLQAADAAITAAVAKAVALIQMLHTAPAGTVSDAEVEAVVADLNAAATALGGATPQP